MKKLLSLGLSISLISSSATLAVACNTSPEKEVTLWLLQESASATSKINSSYQQMVQDYNANRTNKNLPKVKFSWKASGAIQKTLQSGKSKLPDLYISYSDSVSYYKEAPSSKDLVRNMAESMGEGYEEKIKNAVLSEAYLQEGTIGDQVNVLPYFKSLDFSTINLNLFTEISEILFGAEAEKHLRTTINEYNKVRALRTNSASEKESTNLSNIKIFGKLENDQVIISNDQVEFMKKAYKNEIPNPSTSKEAGEESIDSEIYNKLMNTDKTNVADVIKEILTKHETILPFASAISAGLNYEDGLALVKKNENDKYVKLDKINNQNYAIGIDSLINKYFMDYAQAKGENKVSTNEGSDFIYSVTTDIASKKATININSDAPGANKTNDFLQNLKDLAKDSDYGSKNTSSNDQLQQWNGSFILSKMDQGSKTYVNTYFNSGTMLYSSGSTSGMWSYQSTDLSRYDMLASASLNEGGTQGLFLSQGPGIAGFKSQGGNASEKEETVKDFLNYIYKPNIQAINSIQSGYLPSTKDGLSIFEKYHSEKFNNETGKWTNSNGQDIDSLTDDISYKEEVERLEKENDFKFSKIKNFTNNDLLVGKWLSVDMLNDYFGFDYQTGKIDNEKQNIELVIGTPNILGSELRDSFGSAIKKGTNTIMNLNGLAKDKTFANIFDESATDDYTLRRWMKESRSDLIKNIDFTFNKKQNSKGE